MDYKKIANEILDLIGGSKNVATLEHCSTRLRFSLVDKSVVDVKNQENQGCYGRCGWKSISDCDWKQRC